MIIVKVTYRVKQAFAEANKGNIRNFMNDFKEMQENRFRYNVYVNMDGQTFVHVSHFHDEGIQKAVLDTPSFKFFQQQRDQSQLEMAPQIEVMTLVDATVSPL